MAETKVTKGNWAWYTTGVQDKTYEVINTPKYAALFMLNPKYKMDEELEANIKLVADAGNTINKCGLLPSELLEERNDLLKQKEEMIDLLQKHVDYHADDEGELRPRTSQEWFKLIDETSEYLKEITEL